MNNRAFADHGEQGGWTLDTFCQRQQEDWFDPELDSASTNATVGWPDSAGPRCTRRTDRDERGELGEIYVIAVDPDFHGRGLGQQLTLAGLEHLGDRGIRTAMLYVDADNTRGRRDCTSGSASRWPPRTPRSSPTVTPVQRRPSPTASDPADLSVQLTNRFSRTEPP